MSNLRLCHTAIKMVLIVGSGLMIVSGFFFSTMSYAETKMPETGSATTSTASLNTNSENNNQRMSPKQALERLMEGNKRFMEDKTICPERTAERRAATVAKQKPFAIVLGCSDSRIPPELAFDQGIGDIFVVRIAGNVASTLEMESIEYSALVNNSSIIVVLGHQNCGAVDAVFTNNAKAIPALAKLIKPAVQDALNKRSDHSLEEAIEVNIRNSVFLVKKFPAIAKLIKEGKIDVVGAYYHLDSGKVRLLDANQNIPKTLAESRFLYR